MKKAFKIRDSKTGEFISENRIPSKEFSSIWYSLSSLARFIRLKEQQEALHRNVYAGYGEVFIGPLIPSSWEIVEIKFEEVSSSPLKQALSNFTEAQNQA